MCDLKELFDSCAFCYDDYMRSKGLYQTEKKILKKLFHLLNDKTILDLGCGTGELSCYISGHTTAKIIGMDISPKMIEIANKKKKKYNLNNISFYNLDIYSIPQSWNFDFIICSFILGYLRDKNSFINIINKICKEEVILIGVNEKLTIPTKEGEIKKHWEKIDYNKLEKNLLSINLKFNGKFIEKNIFIKRYTKF